MKGGFPALKQLEHNRPPTFRNHKKYMLLDLFLLFFPEIDLVSSRFYPFSPKSLLRGTERILLKSVVLRQYLS